ncbi:plasmid pRiA4b ORF-3 family protein [Vibrio parahaemolyticus]|uniref:plasmid pRiA4b ORF-3 family protein n=1 Tax=Vibrio parahaemolyticus TaxID=670 RepID=UPI003891A37F
MKTYTIKVALRDVSPMVWRRFRLASDTSLAHLHFIIQIAHGWDDEYLHKFRIYGKDYGIYHEGGITFSDNPFHVTLNTLGLEVGDRFTYEYNFFESWLHDIRIEEIKENCSKKVPFCVAGDKMPGVTEFEEIDKMFEFAQALAEADDSTTIGDLRPFALAWASVRFDRQRANTQINKLDPLNPVLESSFILI